MNYTWDFGDGTSASGAQADHTYTTAGTYDVRLTMSTASGESAAFLRTITVVGGPAVKYEPMLAAIGPADGATLYGSEAWVRWHPALNAAAQVLWREKGRGDFRTVEAVGTDLKAGRLGPLQPGQDYEYIVEQRVNGSLERSAVRGFSMRPGPRFEPPAIEQTIARDYNQFVVLTFNNASAEPITVAGHALVQFDDLPADIVGPGSLAEPVLVQPSEIAQLRLCVHAADATQPSYQIPMEAAGAFTTVHLQVPAPPLELACEVVSEDSRTLAKHLRIRNNGATLTDLEVRIASPNDADFRQQPDVNHAYLQNGEELDIVTSPVLYLEFESARVDLECRAAGQTARFPLEFVTPIGKHLIGVRTATGATSFAKDHYCVNRPNTCTTGSGPPGNGPAPEPELAGPDEPGEISEALA